MVSRSAGGPGRLAGTRGLGLVVSACSEAGLVAGVPARLAGEAS